MKSTKKLTTEKFIEKSKSIFGEKYDYSLVEYVNNSTKVKLIFDGICYEQSPMNHFKGFKCENIKKLTQDEFIEKSKILFGDKYDYSLIDFKNVRGSIKLIYNNVVYEQLAYAHLQGKSPEMAPFKITKEEFIKRSKALFDDIFDYSLLVCDDGSKSKVKLIYKGEIYEQVVNDHLNGHLPRDIENIIRDSKGVRIIIEFLTENNIEYKREYIYSDCKNINHLRFDFYLIELNMLIEYDGEQHFRPVSIWGGDKTFKITKKNDRIKNEYCKKNRIPLLRISYLENVYEKLSNNLIMNHI